MQRLTQYEREKIEYLVRCRLGVREIARQLKRDHAVVSRELKRNTGASGRYKAVSAQEVTERRGHITNKRKLDKDNRLKSWVVDRLREEWSPEQISGRLRDHPPKFLKGRQVSHEAIYSWIYDGEGRWMHLYPHLRRGQHMRQRQHARRPKKTHIPERISIHDRPSAIENRERPGDWESDTVCFHKQHPALSVQYERRFRIVRFHRIQDKTALETQRALCASISSLPEDVWKSLTFDNGGEGACHLAIKRDFGIDTYFCDPYASWQKGGVENMNGLIRQYLPKTANLATFTDQDLHRLQERLNDRPRRSLNYRTPNEAMAEYLTQVVH